MIKYRIRTIKNYCGEEVGDDYECTTRLDIDGGKRTYNINRAMSWCNMIAKYNEDGVYEVVEAEE